jgi:hypothetical protein
MKAIFNKIAALLFITSLTIGASAQSIPDTLRINIGVSAGLPIALDNMYTHNLGGFLRLDYPITRQLYVTGSAGYNTLFASPNYSTTPNGILNVKAANMQTVPLKLGIKLFLIRHFYVAAEAGQTFLVNRSAVYAPKNNAFTFSPQVGMLFFLKKRTYIDAGIRYEAVSSFYNDKANYGFWAAHVAYAFNL